MNKQTCLSKFWFPLFCLVANSFTITNKYSYLSKWTGDVIILLLLTPALMLNVMVAFSKLTASQLYISLANKSCESILHLWLKKPQKTQCLIGKNKKKKVKKQKIKIEVDWILKKVKPPVCVVLKRSDAYILICFPVFLRAMQRWEKLVSVNQRDSYMWSVYGFWQQQ